MSLQRVLSIPLEGESITTNELLDLLRRRIEQVRVSDPAVAECILNEIHFKFNKTGIEVIAEFQQ